MAMSRQHVTRTKKFSMIRLHSKQVVSTKTAQHSTIERMVVVVVVVDGWAPNRLDRQGWCKRLDLQACHQHQPSQLCPLTHTFCKGTIIRAESTG